MTRACQGADIYPNLTVAIYRKCKIVPKVTFGMVCRRASRRPWRLLLIGFIVVLCGAWTCASNEERRDVEEISGMKIREVKSLLKERGLECRGCLSKEEHVDMLIANWDRDVDENETSNTNSDKEKKRGERKPRRSIKKPSDERRREAMAEMERQGFGKPTSLSPDDLHGLSEEEIRDQILGSKNNRNAENANKKRSGKKGGGSSTSKRQTRSKGEKQAKTKDTMDTSSSSKRSSTKKGDKKKNNNNNKKKKNESTTGSSSSSRRRTSSSSKSSKKRKTSKSYSKRNSKTKDVDEKERRRRSMADNFIEEDLWGQFYGEERDKPERSIEDEADLIEL